MTPEPSDDDPTVKREMARHAAFEIAARVYELLPKEADWLLTVAKIAAERDYRTKSAQS